jgi:hypothetical protein
MKLMAIELSMALGLLAVKTLMVDTVSQVRAARGSHLLCRCRVYVLMPGWTAHDLKWLSLQSIQIQSARLIVLPTMEV